MQHAGTDIARMRRLVSAATAGNEGNLAGLGRAQVGAQHDRLAVEEGLAGVQRDMALEHFAHHGARIVDQLLHKAKFRSSRSRRP